MLTTSTSMPWPNIFVANISDSKALSVRDHVRRGSCQEGAMPGGSMSGEGMSEGATLRGGKMLASST